MMLGVNKVPTSLSLSSHPIFNPGSHGMGENFATERAGRAPWLMHLDCSPSSSLHINIASSFHPPPQPWARPGPLHLSRASSRSILIKYSAEEQKEAT